MVVFGWSKGNIALIAMWGGIISAFFCIPFAGVMDKYGEFQGHVVYIYNRPAQIRNMNHNHIQIFKLFRERAISFVQLWWCPISLIKKQ